MNNQEKNEQRLNQLESALAYLQNDYEQLNETVLENTKRLEQIKQLVNRLATKLDSGNAGPGEPRNLEDEKPPHY